jgi:hypothetical protein
MVAAPHAIPRILPLDVGMRCNFADQNTPVPPRMATILKGLPATGHSLVGNPLAQFPAAAVRRRCVCRVLSSLHAHRAPLPTTVDDR